MIMNVIYKCSNPNLERQFKTFIWVCSVTLTGKQMGKIKCMKYEEKNLLLKVNDYNRIKSDNGKHK